MRISTDIMQEINEHIEKYNAWYLSLLVIVVLVFSNLAAHSFTNLAGQESYYIIYNATQNSLLQVGFLPITILANVAPFILEIIPLVLGVVSVLLCISLRKKLHLDEIFSFVFLSFIILTPTFIYSFTTLSVIGLYTVYTLLGLRLVVNERRAVQYLSLIPFALATTFNIMLSVLLVLILLALYHSKRVKVVDNTIIATIILAMTIISSLIFSLPLTTGPFYQEHASADLISDLGGVSGVSFFLLLLALVGILFAWKKKFSYVAYVLLIYCISFYLYSSHTIPALAIIICFFASIAFMKLYSRKWKMPLLKNITLFLFVLGLLFSTLSYIDRIETLSLDPSQINALKWIEKNTDQNSVVLALPEQEFIVQALAKRDAIAGFRKDNSIYDMMIESRYIDQSSTLFNQHAVNTIFVTKEMKEQLGEDQGILFLLQNERFKLRFEHDDTQVWTFS